VAIEGGILLVSPGIQMLFTRLMQGFIRQWDAVLVCMHGEHTED
jgi:hypothetical protein